VGAAVWDSNPYLQFWRLRFWPVKLPERKCRSSIAGAIEHGREDRAAGANHFAAPRFSHLVAHPSGLSTLRSEHRLRDRRSIYKATLRIGVAELQSGSGDLPLYRRRSYLVTVAALAFIAWAAPPLYW